MRLKCLHYCKLPPCPRPRFKVHVAPPAGIVIVVFHCAEWLELPPQLLGELEYTRIVAPLLGKSTK